LIIKRRSFSREVEFMQRKLKILAAVLGCMLLVPVLASADFIVYDGESIIFNTTGTWEGPFSANVVGRGGAIDFYTFCVETTETFSPGATYLVDDISTNVVAGISTISTSQALQSATAFLYRSFLDSSSTYDTVEKQNALQAAIYNSQGIGGMTDGSGNLVVGSNTITGLTAYTFYGLSGPTTINSSVPAHTADSSTYSFYSTLLTSASGASGYYNVAVLNIEDSSGGRHQDMLTSTVPLPGAVLLLGAGLARLVAYARRRKED